MEYICHNLGLVNEPVLSNDDSSVKGLKLNVFQHKKRSQSILLLCCVDCFTSEDFQLADPVCNHPIMHCKPLIIDYMYVFVLFSWTLS